MRFWVSPSSWNPGFQRRHSYTAHIPVIALAANAVVGDIEQGLRAGLFNYLTKPIKFDTFIAALNEALAFSPTVAAAANQAGVDINLDHNTNTVSGLACENREPTTSLKDLGP